MVGNSVTGCDSDSQHRRTIPPIHTLGNDLILKLFCYCRPVLFGDDEADDDRSIEGKKWDRERWWYNLARVCQKWRYLILESASYLHICLFCSYGTPVADMLVHSPPLPLVIDYSDEDRDVTAQDEECIFLALQRRLQVRCIRLWMSVSSLRRLLTALDGEFPTLESLYIKSLTDDDNFNGLSLPDTFNAPHLRHFALKDVIYSPGAPGPPLPIPHVPSTEGTSGFPLCHGPQVWRLPRIFIHILDDDSLLNIFYFCHPVMVDEDVANFQRNLQGGEWDRERWWYKLAKVYRRWRCLILASTSYLGLNLLCTFGTPVADMLAHSPRLPLVLDYLVKDFNTNIAAEDEERVMLALRLRDRVRRIRLRMSVANLQKLIAALDGEFPMLEFLYMVPHTQHFRRLTLPDTFRAPHLSHLILNTFAFSIISPLLTTTTRLVTLWLQDIYPTAYFGPNDLLQQLSLLPQLELLRITFHSIPQGGVEMLLPRIPIITHVTLPNLRWFGFQGANAYLEALLPQMATPLLERLQTYFWFQPTYSVPHLLQFMGAAENLSLGSAKFVFYADRVTVDVFSHRGATAHSFRLEVSCRDLDRQVAAAAQIFGGLRGIVSAVEYLFLEIRARSTWLGTSSEADRRNWRALLEPFGNVKTLCVSKDFLTQFSRSLQVGDGGSPMEILPEMKQLEYNAKRIAGDAFDSFIDARKNAGHPVTLVRL